MNVYKIIASCLLGRADERLQNHRVLPAGTR